MSPLIFEKTGRILTNWAIPLVPVLWASFVLFHISLFSIVSRSMWKRGTTHKLIDMWVGIFMFIGVFAVLITTIVMLMGQPPEWSMPWFFDIGRATLYHIGLSFQVVGMLYFAITK